MPARERTNCRRCGALVEVCDKGISVFMFCQTIGVSPRRKSAAPTIYICPSCVMVMAVKPSPPEMDFFNLAAYHMIRNLVGMHRLETQQAFAQIFGMMIEREGQISQAEIMAALPEPEIIMPPERRLRAG
jgi:hypothetical protein